MFKNFLKISLHNFLGHKSYTLINILGLAVGLASVLLIFLFVRHELGFDKFHPGAERTYRLSLEFDGLKVVKRNSTSASCRWISIFSKRTASSMEASRGCWGMGEANTLLEDAFRFSPHANVDDEGIRHELPENSAEAFHP